MLPPAMATILVFGSQVELTTLVVRQLEAAGYEVVPVLKAADALQVLEERHVDVLVLGGPTAWRARDQVFASLVRKAPWAPVILPRSPGDVLVQIERHFSTTQA
jgi:DNA-binding NtrC family response regulator